MTLVSTGRANGVLNGRHYLGPYARGKGWGWQSPEGVMVFSSPTSRRLPTSGWLELVRWCITGGPNAGSQQWAEFVRWARNVLRPVTTVVSYSDPGHGHTGALYRACGWLWAPTWHRLRPPPSGNGAWPGNPQGVKDRWVYPLRPDTRRQEALRLADEALLRRYPWAEYCEPVWKRGRPQGGGGDYRRWAATAEEAPDAA